MRLAAGFAVTALVALVVALRAPLATMVLGLIAFGVLHNVLELRYVAGRFADVLRGRLLWTLLGLITGIVVCRLAAARTVEIFLAYAVLAAGVWYATRAPSRGTVATRTVATRTVATRTTVLRVGGLALLGLALAVSLRFPAYHFVVLAHLHNVVPLFFLWEWSRRLTAGRTAFRVTQVGWVLAVPLLIVLGVFDGVAVGGPSDVAAFAGTRRRLARSRCPPG
jgi:hypothetical protein